MITRRCLYISRWCSRAANNRGANNTRPYSKKIVSAEDERLDFANRKKHLLESRRDYYPLLSRPTNGVRKLRLPEIISTYADKTRHDADPVGDNLILAQGRIKSIRSSGKNLLFIDLMQDFKKLQVVVNRQKLTTTIDTDTFEEKHAFLRRGDIISVRGLPWRTKRGEFSILASESVELMAPCLHPLPDKLNETTKMHKRVVDLAANEDSRDVLLARATIISSMRNFFDQRGFTEVQTPMLAPIAGGASARPFLTSSNALSGDGSEVELALRVAPELWLKRLVISGFDKVYEIGQCFRNEGIDSTHNPEFTSCEFYQSYTDLPELVRLTQDILVHVGREVTKKYPRFQGSAAEFLQEFDTAGVKTHDFISSIEEATGERLPLDFTDVLALKSYSAKHGVKLKADEVETPAKLLDNLAEKFIEPKCMKLGFIVNHPAIMAPLAKTEVVNIGGIERKVSRRFELFYNGKELANAYEEENSPFEQELKFRQQLNDREVYLDMEIPVPDQAYVDAMEWGLPPTGGWGLGIDRLCMMLTGSSRISQVLSFGGAKVVNYQ